MVSAAALALSCFFSCVAGIALGLAFMHRPLMDEKATAVRLRREAEAFRSEYYETRRALQLADKKGHPLGLQAEDTDKAIKVVLSRQ